MKQLFRYIHEKLRKEQEASQTSNPPENELYSSINITNLIKKRLIVCTSSPYVINTIPLVDYRINEPVLTYLL